MDKILIVDDSVLQATQLKNILAEDYDVTMVHTAEDGLKMAGTGEYSLILLDIVMPGTDGFTVLRLLQEELITQHIPVVIITSLSDIDNEAKGLTLGAVDYIAKPFHPQIIKARVNTHVKLYCYRKQVETQSMTDQLTGVYNRRRHDRYSVVKWQEATRLEVPFSVCMFDIDKFKIYNDTFGHPAGDKVITQVAQTISTQLRRNTDFFARYGGEEFVAIMMGEKPENAFRYLCGVRQAVENLHIPHKNPKVSPWVTISVGGVTVVPQWGSSYKTYLKIADTMLYDAKRFGRNQVVWSDGKSAQWREKP